MALDLFRLQYENNELYKTYVNTLGIVPNEVNSVEKIPFLPVQFYKSHKVTSTAFEPEVIFESSGTTGDRTSRHYIKRTAVYRESFTTAFRLFYGNPQQWCIMALLPGYLERENSSLVYMVNELIKISGSSCSGFYLHDHKKLYKTLVHNEITEQPTLLIGVTYALLDFAEKYSMDFNHTRLMETGGMKGKREELTREEMHKILKERLSIKKVHSEYGMTELLSQAYSSGNGLFHCPPWMKVLVREYNDPFSIVEIASATKPVTGLINIIDLANIYSCCFIATDDVGRLFKNETFEVLGRQDMSDTRGCNLLTAGSS
ncbi:MAG TPA: acyl transferase [Chitinophagaceae bacterium]|nr:acyl transferase [Chitinophagaceae bacterium]